VTQRKRILTIFGTRPEAVKLAPVLRALSADHDAFESVVCCTGQHEQLVRQAMTSFEIVPDIDLESMRPGQSLGQLTSRLFAQIDETLARVEPDWVLVQGDTASAMVGATCAFYRRIRVGHVEAGLRTGDRLAPFPEEINRVTISRVVDLHFAPTPRAAANLRAEGVDEGVHVTGNTVVDALEWIRPRIERHADPAVKALAEKFAEDSQLVLVTSHRRESFGEGIEQICKALAEVTRRNARVAVVFVTHLNPNVLEPVRRLLGAEPRIALIEPTDYFSLLYLMLRCRLILTDSGGIQEEAPSFGKPVLVMRTVTERPEAVEAGCARIVGTDRQEIISCALELLENPDAYGRMVATQNPFGDGKAGERIAALLRGGAPVAAEAARA
jgi:UDP-N-acetylglucosamine 2-epimerase (non-hydrolysing)